MLKSKKFILIAVLAVVLVAGSIGGIVLAATPSTGTTTGTNPVSGNNTIMARVAAILHIDQATLQSAFTQAAKEQKQAAIDSYLGKQVAAGKITQAQADAYKAWLAAQPAMPSGFGPGTGAGRMGPMMKRGFGGRFPGQAPRPPATVTPPVTQ